MVDSNLSDYIKVSDNVTTLGIGAEVVLKQATTNSVSTGVETKFAGFDVSSQRHTLNFGTTEAETTKAKRIQMTTVQTSVENITQQLTTTSPRGTTHSSGGALTNGKIVGTVPFEENTYSLQTNYHINHVTTAAPLHTTNLEPIITTKSIFYSIYNSNELHHYILNPTLKKQSTQTIPFSTYQTSIVYNQQISSIEVIGDYWDSANNNHFRLNKNESFRKFQRISPSFYRPERFSTIAYVDSIGTICLGNGIGLV